MKYKQLFYSRIIFYTFFRINNILLQDIIYNQKKINRLKGQMKQITYLILLLSLIVYISTQDKKKKRHMDVVG